MGFGLEKLFFGEQNNSAGWTLLDIKDMEKSFLDFLEIKPKKDSLKFLPFIVTPGTPQGLPAFKKIQNPAPKDRIFHGFRVE